MYVQSLWIGLILLIAIAIIELWKPALINESFENLISVGDSAFWAKWIPRRGDVSLDPTEEQDGYLRDTRYFSGYTDIQRIGQDQDFCRMVQSKNDPEDKFFACALGGTDGLSTVKYRTPSVKDGFILSRDDYMNDLGEGRSGYCRILKSEDGTFEAKCNPAGDTTFKSNLVMDSNPPKEIKTMLMFYEGIVFWLRMRDDLLDYAKNLIVSNAGDLEIDETPNPPITHGLEFNGKDQYLRIGDTRDLAFGDVIQLRYLRAVSFWVYFEEFTNNAHIFDFGEQNQPSVWCGILGRGNPGKQQTEPQTLCFDQALNTVPTAPSGATCVAEIDPKSAYIDVEQWNCPAPELFGRIMDPIQPKASAPAEAKTADLLYEIWDKKQRKLHIQVKDVIPLRKWVHITITASNNDAFRPGLHVYRDGELVHKEESAWLPQDNYTTHNYIGKSNWMNVTSQYDNADELFKGKMFDFRGYKTTMTEKKIKDTYSWGKKMLDPDADN